MSEIQAANAGVQLVEKGIRMLPSKVSAPLIKALQEGTAKKLTAKQTNLVAFVVNDAAGRQVITLEDVARERNGVKADATKRGCLDPCDGIDVNKLAKLVKERLGGS